MATTTGEGLARPGLLCRPFCPLLSAAALCSVLGARSCSACQQLAPPVLVLSLTLSHSACIFLPACLPAPAANLPSTLTAEPRPASTCRASSGSLWIWSCCRYCRHVLPSVVPHARAALPAFLQLQCALGVWGVAAYLRCARCQPACFGALPLPTAAAAAAGAARRGASPGAAALPAAAPAAPPTRVATHACATRSGGGCWPGILCRIL